MTFRLTPFSKAGFHALWSASFIHFLQTPSLISVVAWRVQPRNYLLFVCHTTNAVAQSVQGARFVNYWYYGGRERKYGLTGSEPKGSVTPAPKELTKSDAK